MLNNFFLNETNAKNYEILMISNLKNSVKRPILSYNRRKMKTLTKTKEESNKNNLATEGNNAQNSNEFFFAENHCADHLI